MPISPTPVPTSLGGVDPVVLASAGTGNPAAGAHDESGRLLKSTSADAPDSPAAPRDSGSNSVLDGDAAVRRPAVDAQAESAGNHCSRTSPFE